MKKLLFFLLCWAIILCLPLFLSVNQTFPRLDTDYDSSLPIYQYMVTFIRSHHTFPLIIPLVNGGIPVLGDPLNSFLNPMLGLPLLFFGINWGLRIAILLSCLFSGISMLVLLQSKQIRQKISLWASCLYMSGGAFFAAIASGHIEKFLIYPLVPFLLLFSLEKRISFTKSFLLGLVFAATVYSGDVYATWFFFLIFLTIRVYYFLSFWQKKEVISFLLPLLLFILLASPVLVPFIFTVFPDMKRISDINPYKGSLHFFFFPLPFLMPLGVWFWDRPFFQRNLGFYYNWYEYFAFLSPIPFLFLLRIKAIWNKEMTRILCVILLMGIWYFSLGYPYSPFYWLFHVAPPLFRVPQRIVLSMTSVVVMLIALALQKWVDDKTLPRITIVLLALTLFWTTLVDWHILFETFPKELILQKEAIEQLAAINKRKLPVVDFAQSTQLFLIENDLPVADYYYGWTPEKTEMYMKNAKRDYIMLLDKRPVYVVTDGFTNLAPYGYQNFMKNSTIALWQRRN